MDLDTEAMLELVQRLVKSRRTVERKRGANIIEKMLSSVRCPAEARNALEEHHNTFLLKQHQYAALGDRMRMKLRDPSVLVSDYGRGPFRSSSLGLICE